MKCQKKIKKFGRFLQQKDDDFADPQITYASCPTEKEEEEEEDYDSDKVLFVLGSYDCTCNHGNAAGRGGSQRDA